MYYKYLEIDANCDSIESSLSRILVNPTIKLSSSKYLNDPNEMKFSYGVSRSRKTQAFEHWKAMHPGKSYIEFEAWLQSFNEDRLASLLTEFKLYRRKNFKIASFSTSHKSNLLWSHYAGRSNGFCVIYKKSFLAPFEGRYEWLAGPVKYSNRPKVVRVAVDSDLDSIKKICFHKEKCWQYENEYRIVIIEGSVGPVFVEISRSDILGVILGINASEEFRSKIAQICKDMNLKLFEIFNYHSTYRLPAVEIVNPDERLMINKF